MGFQIPHAGDLQFVLALVGLQAFLQLLVHLILVLAAGLHDAVGHQDVLQHLNIITAVVEGDIGVGVADGRAVAVNQLVVMSIHCALDAVGVVALDDMHLQLTVLIPGDALDDGDVVGALGSGVVVDPQVVAGGRDVLVGLHVFVRADHPLLFASAGDDARVGHKASALHEPGRAFLAGAVPGIEVAQHLGAVAGVRLVDAPGQELRAPGAAAVGEPGAILALVAQRALDIADLFLGDLQHQQPGLGVDAVLSDDGRLPFRGEGIVRLFCGNWQA